MIFLICIAKVDEAYYAMISFLRMESEDFKK